MDRNDSTRASKEKNELKVSEKPIKNRASRMFKPMPKKQSKVKSTKVLITEITSLFEKNWERDQTSAFLTACKRKEDKNFNRTNLTKQDPLHILVAAIHKVNAANLSNFSLSTQLDIE